MKNVEKLSVESMKKVMGGQDHLGTWAIIQAERARQKAMEEMAANILAGGASAAGQP